MTRDSFNQRSAFTRPDGPYVKPRELNFARADARRKVDAECGSAALLAAYRRYFVRQASRRVIGQSISDHEADKARHPDNHEKPPPEGVRQSTGA